MRSPRSGLLTARNIPSGDCRVRWCDCSIPGFRTVREAFLQEQEIVLISPTSSEDETFTLVGNAVVPKPQEARATGTDELRLIAYIEGSPQWFANLATFILGQEIVAIRITSAERKCLAPL